MSFIKQLLGIESGFDDEDPFTRTDSEKSPRSPQGRTARDKYNRNETAAEKYGWDNESTGSSTNSFDD